jgi:hypothetical protein
MSNEELKKYKQTHSRLISKFAELHNRHLLYIEQITTNGKISIRKLLREVREIAKEAWQDSDLVYKAHLKDKKEKTSKLPVNPANGKKIYPRKPVSKKKGQQQG